VEIVNEIIAERTLQEAGRVVSHAPVAGPRLSARALAASQGRAYEVRGVQHRRSEAKQARDRARFLEKRFNAESSTWMRAARADARLWQDVAAWRRWEQQRNEVDRAWDHAVELSEAAGYPYKIRAGEMVNDRGDVSLFGLAVARYMAEMREAAR
jgi:hypothetical protein